MNKTDDFAISIKGCFPCKNKYLSILFFFSIFLFVIYSNSFDCSWHYDDYANIVTNSSIHISDLSWQSIEKGFYGVIDSPRWQRPVAYFSFALNYYVGGLNVFGYHIVNFLIHLLTAFFLFLFVYNTLQLDLIRASYKESAYSIALLSAFLWAINPVQVTSVTYIVQRMASMVALFYIMTMFFYLKGRTSDDLWEKRIYFFLAFLAGVLAVGTKENAALLPVSIFLYDLLLIQGVTKENIKKSFKYGAFAIIAVIVIGLLYIGDVTTISSDYKIRPFSMIERLLTQPRILVFYISLLLYPISSRLMLIHDVNLSTSLLSPWTTIPAILFIFFLIVFAIGSSKRWPLLSFCILFFFINHFIEGSFIALELIYEHRNYLPSMLFFLPLSILIIRGLHYYATQRLIWWTMVAGLIGLMIVQGVTVYIQNDVYKDDVSLWTDNKDKAPNLHTVRQNAATSYFLVGRTEEAFEEGQQALKSYQAAMPSRKSRTHGLLGEYYFKNGKDDDALLQYKESIKLDPTYHVIYRRIAEIMIHKNRLPDAEYWIRKGISVKPDSFTYHAILARILVKKGSPDSAIHEAFISLRLNPNQWEPYLILADAFTLRKEDTRAKHFRIIAEAQQKSGWSYVEPLFIQAAT
ncbi:MAG: hypothetical protein CSYNP_01689 [Syntrophus sp. SKADARSKE-3]|nr:hypothetical protein [Syntrophus sp. SKADARSKE-3]